MAGLTPVPVGPAPAGLPEPIARLDRTAVMGIINVTADSFSDGGRYLDPAAARARAQELVAAGADLIDVGGESTRPGAQRIPAQEEQRRVLPIISAVRALGVAVSVDTMRAATARAAVAAGASVVNDVSGGLADPGMLAAAAELEVPYVIMHWRGHSDRMDEASQYRDVVGEVADHLARRVEAALAAGVRADRIVVDPGLGFAKQTDHNWQLLRDLDRAVPRGYPVLLGASRKRFLGATLADPDGRPRPVDQRDAATAALSALAAAAGAWCVRVHDVRASSDAVRLAAAWRAGSSRQPGPSRPSPDQEARG